MTEIPDATANSTWKNFKEFDLSEIKDPTWHSILLKHEPFLKQMSSVLRKEFEKYEGYFDIFPPVHLVFNALKLTPFDKVKCVLFGQDPYHGPGQAMGLCFSVNRGINVPPSLWNIYKELEEDPNIVFQKPNHGDLSSWAKQGVLMLNTALTVRQGKAHSHAAFKLFDSKGKKYFLKWRTLIDDIVMEINKRKNNVVWMLWGSPAKKAYGSQRNATRKKEVCISQDKHLILEATHPSPLGANQGGWFGCRHFSKCNEFLLKNGESQIDWNLPK
jgi:uracil-DNA glycosylase